MKCAELVKKLEDFAPLDMAESWDNPGLIIGNAKSEINKVLVALDATSAVVDEAVEIKADLIVTHHPMIFGSVKKITSETPNGARIMKLIKNDIAHYAMHTNLDWTNGGTNDELSKLIGLKGIRPLRDGMPGWKAGCGFGRLGELEKSLSFKEFSENVKNVLGLEHMSVVGEVDRKIKKVAVCTGSGIEFMKDAVEKCADVFITADLRYHESQKAVDSNICLIDATHYASENIIVPVIKKYIDEVLAGDGSGVQVITSKVNGQVFKYV